MDASDLAILRAMTTHRVSVWGGIDPRVSSSDVADRVGLHPSTVRARIRDWRDCGFLQGYDVIPNPHLFDAELAVYSARIDDPTAKPAFLDEVGLIEGVIAALDHVGPWIGGGIVVDRADAVERRWRLLEKLPGVAEVEDPYTAHLPRLATDPTQLDWRIVRALREGPDDTIAAIADRVGVTAKTLTRRYRALLEGNAIWSVAVLDFRNYTGGVACRVNLFLDDAAHREAVREGFADRHPEALEINPIRDRHDEPTFHDRVVEYLLHLDSQAEADDVLRDAAELDGVADCEVLFPVAYHPYPDWLDERVEKACAGER